MHRGYNRTRQLVEFIELSRMFGATHFTLYDYLGNLTVLNPVIREYEKQGLLELVNWKLAGMVTDHVLNPEEERFVKGFEDQCTQVLAHTECLYRNLHKYKYIAFYDLDEMLVPGYNRTWPELVKLIPKNYSSFIFHNRFFPLRNRVKEELGKYNDPLLIKYHPVSLEYTLAESEIVFTRPKVMVLGKGVSKCRVHHVVHLSGSHPFDIPVHLGTMWHYRSRPPKDSKKPAERDYYMYKFKDELLARMDRIFQKTRALIV
ncbi:glycosyltransferase family 92 protein ZK381.2 [Lingula anatina]|uniref:Glycosyltransferase family 92 protein n=1 Tax=Lingula anatina TaxID=7574 RepID=A0A1S3JNT8_LINAN|nr:glycosyltransferase family 92 protein ZK381.2 [Lingula anatina]XP_013411801.1 glycosyltransferase family 92 protein ZK381.2 [Lingula anatina]|eukprot:XP_013411800.1 glycosyltransferase family 92 protein ZK381.2 [Lingula anatina]